MCMSHSDLIGLIEGAVMDVLCEKCLCRVERKLEGTEKTLSSFSKEDYGFCAKCKKAIDRAEREVVEDHTGLISDD